MEGELRRRPEIEYLVKDVAELNKSLFNKLFDIVIDKGLLDCLLTNSFEPLTAMKQSYRDSVPAHESEFSVVHSFL